MTFLSMTTVPALAAGSDSFSELKMGVTMYKKNADSFLQKNAKLVLRQSRKSSMFGVRKTLVG